MLRYRPYLALALMCVVVLSSCGASHGSDGDAGTAPSITATSDVLPAAPGGVPLARVALSAFGTAPITWSVDGGALPAGVMLDASTGALVGAPMELGTFSFVAKATNAAGSDTHSFFIEVVQPPADAHLLLANNQIATLNVDFPNVIGTPMTVTGIMFGETLVAIARRPQNGMLYGIGVDATMNTYSLYGIATHTAYASVVGTPYQGLTTDGATPADFPPTAFSMSFDPSVDRLRVVAESGLNFRVNPTTGEPIDGDNGGGSGVVEGVNPDGSLHGATFGSSGVSYTNDVVDGGNVTTLYSVSSVGGALHIQNPPNYGTLSVVAPFAPTVTSVRGFDIPPGVNAPANNAAVTAGSGYVLGTITGQSVQSIARIDLLTGALSRVSALPNLGAIGLAVQRTPSLPAIGLAQGGDSLLRFYSGSPGATTAVAVTGIIAGEQLVSIDYRAHTGQLYGFGVDAGANTATLYLVDPNSAECTVVGSRSSIRFVDLVGTRVDLPSGVTTHYGMDFDPAVDLVRIVTETGLNFRLNPRFGTPVDGDNGGAAGSVFSVNTDGVLNGSFSGAAGLAYTNDPGSLTGAASSAFLLRTSSHSLARMSAPTSGTSIAAMGLILGGSPLAFSSVGDIDVAPPTSVAASNAAPTSGVAYAVLTVAGWTRLCTIDLVTGAATDLGSVGLGEIHFVGFAIGADVL